MAETPRQAVRRRFIDEYRGASITLDLTLATPELQRLFRRRFDAASAGLFFSRFYAQVLGDEVRDQAVRHLADAAQRAETDLHERLETARGLLNGQPPPTFKGSVQTVRAVVIDPLAKRYLDLLVRADVLTQHLYGLWLTGLLDDHQRRRAHQDIDTTLKGFQRSALLLSISLRRRVEEAQRAAKAPAGPDAADPGLPPDPGGPEPATPEEIEDIEEAEEVEEVEESADAGPKPRKRAAA